MPPHPTPPHHPISSVATCNVVNDPRDLSSMAIYHLRSTRNVNMPPHPTPPHPTPPHPTIAIFKNVRFTGTVFGPQAKTCVNDYIQYLIHWLLCRTPFTRITSHNLSKYGLFQSRFQYGLFQNPGLHTCFGLNLNRGLNKINVFASEPSFTQRAVLHKTVLSTKHVLHKNHVLAGPVQGRFAAYKIALSMVAGGTRRKRLNIEKHVVNEWQWHIQQDMGGQVHSPFQT